MGKLRESLTPAEAAEVADVFTQHRPFIEAVAAKHAPSVDHVPDIVQAVGIQVCRGLNGFRQHAMLKTWLFRVTVNTARTYFRQEARQRRVRQAIFEQPRQIATDEDPDETIYQGERLDQLEQAIDQLRPEYRAAMRNHLRERGVLSGSSKAVIHRARQSLRRMLGDDLD